MSTEADNLEQLLSQLPEQIRGQVKDYVEFLLSRKKTAKRAGLKQDWAGALREYRDKYTSLSLQAKASEWRGD
jgi:hypothetical protein